MQNDDEEDEEEDEDTEELLGKGARAALLAERTRVNVNSRLWSRLYVEVWGEKTWRL